MKYEEWLAQAPDSLKSDPIWKFEAYPKALLLFDLAWEDTEHLMRDKRGRKLPGSLSAPPARSRPTLTKALGAH